MAVGEGTIKAAQEDPAWFIGETAAGFVTGGRVMRGVKATGSGLARQAAKVSPGYERGMTSYTGVPRIRDVISGDATFQQYLGGKPTRYTPPTTPAKVADPGLAEQPQSFYHGTSDIFGQLGSMERGIRVDAGKPSVVESSMFFGPPSTGLARYLPSDGAAYIKVRAPVRPYSARVTSLIEQGAPRQVIEPLVTREFLNAPPGEILPGVKPTSGKTFHGELQSEYMAKPGTELYPVENWRTRLYGRFGLTRGTGWTYDPITGRRVEVYEFSTTPQPARSVKPVIDVPALRRDIIYNPVVERVTFGARKVASAMKSPARRYDEWAAERTLVREMKAKGIPEADINSFRAGVRLGRAVRGMDSPVTGDIILDALTEIGPEYAADVQAILRENPAVLYGSGIATGQTPQSAWWRGFKDLDVHLDRRDIAKFIKDAKAMYKRHGLTVVQRGLSLVDKKTGQVLLDIHEAPGKYPLIGKTDVPATPYSTPPKTRPFSFIPDELLRGPQYLQERLYTQAQRKLSSITEQLEKGKIKESREKDFGDGIMTVEVLLDYAESLLHPSQILQARKFRRMRDDLETLKNNPKVKPLWEDARGDAATYRAARQSLLDKALREELGVPDSVQHPTPALLKQISDQQFLEPTQITKPTAEMVQDARAAVARKEIRAGQMKEYLAARVDQANRMFAEAVQAPTPTAPRIRVSRRGSPQNWREPGSLVIPDAIDSSLYGGAVSSGVKRGASATAVAPYGADAPHQRAPSPSPVLSPLPSARRSSPLSPSPVLLPASRGSPLVTTASP
ncbi:MAG: hypothetical protein WC277_09400, partial [Bacilli bacterium]